MPWWSRVGDRVEKHEKLLWAAFACNFARSTGTPMDALGIYRKDPVKHPGTPNDLPAFMRKAAERAGAKRLRAASKRGRQR